MVRTFGNQEDEMLSRIPLTQQAHCHNQQLSQAPDYQLYSAWDLETGFPGQLVRSKSTKNQSGQIYQVHSFQHPREEVLAEDFQLAAKG